MDNETELNILSKQKELEEKQKQLEEWQSLGRESAVTFEKTIALLKEGASLSSQVSKTKADYQLAILTYEAENYIKLIDICIDILKFLIPTLFSIWAATRIIPQFSGTSTTFLLLALSACLTLLVIAIVIRIRKVRNNVSKFKEEHTKFVLDSLDWQTRMAEAQDLELTVSKSQIELLKAQVELVKAKDNTNHS